MVEVGVSEPLEVLGVLEEVAQEVRVLVMVVMELRTLVVEEVVGQMEIMVATEVQESL